MFEINMLVAIVVMFNILKLIMKLFPNYSRGNNLAHIMARYTYYSNFVISSDGEPPRVFIPAIVTDV